MKRTLESQSLGAAIGLAALLAAVPAHALPPDQLYERVAPAVWSVKAYAAEERLLASASGVVVAPGKVVTSCQVLARAQQVQLRRGNQIYEAKLEYPDVERDLCQLDAPGLTAPALAPGSSRGLRPGQRLYVVGFARGNVQSIGEGLVSALAGAGTGKERILTTIPAARGLLGAGVFDEDARLVGVVTVSPRDAAASAFAVPADWLAELASRGRAAIAGRSKSAAAAAPAAVAIAPRAAPGLPAAGTTWTYSYIERIYSRKQVEVAVRVLRVDDAIVEEALTTTASAGKDFRRIINAREPRFLEQPLGGNATLIELAPYLVAVNGEKAPLPDLRPTGYPIGDAGLSGWITRVRTNDWEQVMVPAGTFRALRVEVDGKRERPPFTNHVVTGSFKLTAWYAPEVKRIVRLEHEVRSGSISGSGSVVGNEVVELLKYVPGS